MKKPEVRFVCPQCGHIGREGEKCPDHGIPLVCTDCKNKACVCIE